MIKLKMGWEEALTKRIKEEKSSCDRSGFNPADKEGFSNIKGKIKELYKLIVSGSAVIES